MPEKITQIRFFLSEKKANDLMCDVEVIDVKFNMTSNGVKIMVIYKTNFMGYPDED